MSDEVWTILRVLDSSRTWFEKRGLESPRLDAEVLIADALGLQRVMLYAHFDRVLGEEELTKIRERVRRRGQREPVAYITGRREFWSMEFEVGPSVLIPRPDTETLVEVALELARARGATKIADVGTGSGCIALALAKELPEAEVCAFDVSASALAIAKRNAERHALTSRVQFVESDLLAGAKGRRFELVAANLPYISEGEHAGLAADVLAHEPKLALVGGPDGLDPIRRLIREAPGHLLPGGLLVLEGGATQMTAVSTLMREAGFLAPEVRRDDGGHERVAWATWPETSSSASSLV